VLLGYAYERGLANLSKSGNLAQAFHRRAAEGGFPRGMNAYGGALENGFAKGGNPTRADIELGLQWYRASAAAGCAKGRENAVSLEKWLRDNPPAPPSRPAYTCHDQCRGRGPADPTARAAVYQMCMDSCAASSR
jgi:TPR repeat protein